VAEATATMPNLILRSLVAKQASLSGHEKKKARLREPIHDLVPEENPNCIP